MTDKVRLLIDLVHGIDALEAERTRVVAPLDEKIKTAREQLAALANGRTPRVTRTSNAKLGTGKKLIDLMIATPDAPPGIRATQLYGEDTAANRKKLRSLLRGLSEVGRVRRAENGQWTVVAESATAEVAVE